MEVKLCKKIKSPFVFDIFIQMVIRFNYLVYNAMLIKQVLLCKAHSHGSN